MKNSIISIVLFLCTMVLVFFLNNSLIQLCDEVHQRADVMEETILNGDLESAFEHSMDLVDLLKEKNFEASIYITHEYFDTLVDEAYLEVNNEIYELTVSLGNKRIDGLDLVNNDYTIVLKLKYTIYLTIL